MILLNAIMSLVGGLQREVIPTTVNGEVVINVDTQRKDIHRRIYESGS